MIIPFEIKFQIVPFWDWNCLEKEILKMSISRFEIFVFEINDFSAIFFNIQKRTKMAKWPNNFISGKPFQKRPNGNHVEWPLTWLISRFLVSDVTNKSLWQLPVELKIYCETFSSLSRGPAECQDQDSKLMNSQSVCEELCNMLKTRWGTQTCKEYWKAGNNR